MFFTMKTNHLSCLSLAILASALSIITPAAQATVTATVQPQNLFFLVGGGYHVHRAGIDHRRRIRAKLFLVHVHQ